MVSRPAATVALSSLCDTVYNALSWAQGSLQEEVSVAVSHNTVSSTSETSLMYLADRTINELLRWLYRMRRIGMADFKPSTTMK